MPRPVLYYHGRRRTTNPKWCGSVEGLLAALLRPRSSSSWTPKKRSVHGSSTILASRTWSISWARELPPDGRPMEREHCLFPRSSVGRSSRCSGRGSCGGSLVGPRAYLEGDAVPHRPGIGMSEVWMRGVPQGDGRSPKMWAYGIADDGGRQAWPPGREGTPVPRGIEVRRDGATRALCGEWLCYHPRIAVGRSLGGYPDRRPPSLPGVSWGSHPRLQGRGGRPDEQGGERSLVGDLCAWWCLYIFSALIAWWILRPFPTERE